MKLRDRLQKIYDLRWEYERQQRINRLVNHPNADYEGMRDELNIIAHEHNQLAFWPMKKLPTNNTGE